MTFDLLAAIELTTSAALAVALLAAGLGATARARWRWAAGLTAWFAAIVALAATGVLNGAHGLGTPGLGVVVAAPFVVAAMAARISAGFRRAVATVPLSWLIGVNALRVLGVNFVLLEAAGRLPSPFAPSAGWGDMIAGAAALPVAWWLGSRGRAARPVVLAWNTFGLLDLVSAVSLGVLSSPGPLHLLGGERSSALMTTLPWLLIPGFLVPFLALTHLAVFARLAGRQPAFDPAAMETAEESASALLAWAPAPNRRPRP